MRIDTQRQAVAIAAPALLLGLALALAGCAGLPAQHASPDFSGEASPGSVDEAWQTWVLDGQTEDAHRQFAARHAAGFQDANTLFGLAETSLLSARYTDAVAAQSEFLTRHPTHPLAPEVAMRLWQSRDHAPGWRQASAGTIRALRRDGEGQPNALAQALLGRIALEVAHRDNRSTLNAPAFDDSHLGFSRQWRVAGPLSVFPSLDRDTVFPADSHDQLHDEYEHDGFVEATADLFLEGTRCNPTLHKTGVHLLETWIETRTPQDVVAMLETRHDVILDVDGVRLFNMRRKKGDATIYHARTLTLSAGVHRIRVRLAVRSQSTDFLFQLTPVDGSRFEGAFTKVRPSGRSGDTSEVGPDLFSAIARSDAKDPWTAWTSGILLAETGATGDLLAKISQTRASFPRFAAPLVTQARGIERALLLHPTVARESAITLLREALELDPTALAAADRLAWMLIDDGRSEEALGLLEPLGKARPGEYLVEMRRYQAFSDLGWTVEARRALARASHANPNNCSVVAALWDQWDAQSTWPDPGQALTGEQRACNVSQRQIALRYDAPRGDYNAASDRLALLAAREPRDPEILTTLADMYQRAGRTDDADRTWSAAATVARDPVQISLAQLDVLTARGEERRAREQLASSLAKHPGSYGLRRASAGLEGKNVLEDLRIDGRPIIRDFLDNPVAAESSAIYILDYAATRVFEDGSSMTNTHVIVRVQNKDGIDAFGEVDIPASALLLMVRTVKPDGVFYEPDFVPGKPSISMPNLEAGDFVEYEYLEAREGSSVRANTYAGFRFYFNIFDAPLLRSEYVIDLPSAWRAEVESLRGAPAPKITELGRFRRHHFLVERGPQAYAEPSAAPSAEFLPSIRVSSGLQQWDEHRLWRDQTVAVSIPNWLMRQSVHKALRGVRGERQRAYALWQLLFEHVAGDDGDIFAQSAAETWSLGRGNRTVALHTLLTIAGIESEFVFARPWSADNTPHNVLSTDELQWVILRARIEGEWVWLDPSQNHAIFGYVPPAIQGNVGMRLGPAQDATDLFVEIPALPSASDMRRVKLDLRIDPDGNLTGQVEETYTGDGATTFRRILDSYTDKKELEEAIEQSMAGTFPGVDITELTFEAGADARRPFVMRYTMSASAFATRTGKKLGIDRPFFAAELTASYATLPRRNMTLLTQPVRVDLDLTLHLPDGATAESLADDIDLQSEFGRILRKTEVSGSTVHVRREFTLSVARVATTQYSAFQEFARISDSADPLRLTITR
jgi:tetratricopeptide (TPR) repeat protein